MARDNAACNRAIRKAWARERELVLAGKGSRNWTQEQREQLITKGKVYDDDGKAFIGQHMKSVSGFPDNQGEPTRTPYEQSKSAINRRFCYNKNRQMLQMNICLFYIVVL